jgi:type II secretory pathway component PulM
MSALRQFWQARSASEQKTLRWAALVLLGLLLWQFAIQPVRRNMSSMRSEITRLDQALTDIARLTSTRKAIVASSISSTPGSASLTAVIDQAVRARNMQSGLKNITPEQNGKVAVELGGVNFDQLMQLLEQLETEQGARVVEMSVDTLGSSTVNAKFTVAK